MQNNKNHKLTVIHSVIGQGQVIDVDYNEFRFNFEKDNDKLIVGLWTSENAKGTFGEIVVSNNNTSVAYRDYDTNEVYPLSAFVDLKRLSRLFKQLGYYKELELLKA
ncbi:TPA_asm: hypothetical protein GZX72_14230 [Listeria monocytogenes]|nr:hypothetical protein [Listeria monocytogenes]